MTDLGRLLLVLGTLLLLAGGLILLLGRFNLSFGRLPGDLALKRSHWAIYFPITSSILLSIVLSLVLWAINHVRR